MRVKNSVDQGKKVWKKGSKKLEKCMQMKNQN